VSGILFLIRIAGIGRNLAIHTTHAVLFAGIGRNMN
jgi:hypothetical protein